MAFPLSARRAALSHVAFLLLLTVLAALFYSNRVFVTGVNGDEDLVEQDIPNSAFFVRAVRDGAFPLWNPYKLCGLPFFDVPFMGPYYPLVFLYFVFPAGIAVNCGFMVHILLSGVWMWLLAREVKLSAPASFFCAATWTVCSVFQSYSASGWLPETVATSYLPLGIYLVARVLRETGPRTATLPDGRGAAASDGKPSQIAWPSLRAGGRRTLLLSLMIGVVLALAITGGHTTYALIVIYSLLFFAAPSLGDKRSVGFLLAALAAAALLSMATWGPLYVQATRYPGVQQLTNPEYQYRLEDLGNFLVPSDLRRGFLGKIGLILGLAGVWKAGTPYRRNFIALLLCPLFFMFGGIQVGGVNLLILFPFANQATCPWTWHMGLILSLTVFAGASLDALHGWARRRPRWCTVLLTACIALQLADLYAFHRKLYPRQFAYTIDEYFPQAPLVEFFRQDRSLFRVSNRFYDSPLLGLNQGVLDEVAVFESRVRGPNLWKVVGVSALSGAVARCPPMKTVDLCNIKYVVCDRPLESAGLTLRLQAKDPISRGAVLVYQNDRCLPRALLLEGMGEHAVREALLKDRGGPPLLLLDTPDPVRRMMDRYKTVDVQWSPNTYTVAADCAAPSFLFLSEMHEEGWRAEVNGEPAAVESPFGFFMGVFLPAGKHTVVFRFAPWYWRVFCAVSLGALIATAALAVYCWTRDGAP